MSTLDQILKIFNEADWGTWVKAETVQFQPGDIFLLDTSGSGIKNFDMVYKADGAVQANHYLKLFHWSWREQRWMGGHGWYMKGNAAVVRFPKGPSISVAKAPSNGCICRRCNARNEYAVPNQKDGSYICFECR